MVVMESGVSHYKPVCRIIKKSNKLALTLAEHIILQAGFFTGRLVSKFPNGKITVGTATLFNTVLAANRGRYALTCASNLYNITHGGSAVEVLFQYIHSDMADAGYRPFIAEDWFYPEEFTENCLPDDLDRRLVQVSQMRRHDRYNYGIIKLDSNVQMQNYPDIAEYKQEIHRGEEVLLHGFYGIENLQLNGRALCCDIISTNETELYFESSMKICQDGTAIMNRRKKIIALHLRKALFQENRHYGLIITPTINDQIMDWQF